MINKMNLKKAYVEIYEIIKYIEGKENIPNEFISMLEKNKDKYYAYEYDINKSIQEQELLRETIVLLGYIYIYYLGTEKEKEYYENNFKQDILTVEKILEEDKVRI